MNTKAILIALICVAALLSTVMTTSTCAQTVDDCMACHQDRTLTKADPDGTVKSLHVDGEAFLKSVHAEAGFTCVDCHQDAQPSTHPATGLAPVDCQSCHDEVSSAHAQSFHGRMLRDGISGAPQCYDCHTSHAVMSSDNPTSSVHPDRLQKTCGSCHVNETAPVVCEAVLDLAAGDTSVLKRISLASTLSIITTRLKGHGKTDFGCSYSTRSCSDCHTEVGRHSGGEKQQPVCAGCHDMKRSALLFGKIHKPTIFAGPMIIVLLSMYALCIGGLVLYFKKTSTAGKAPTDPSAG